MGGEGKGEEGRGGEGREEKGGNGLGRGICAVVNFPLKNPVNQPMTS